MARKLRLKRTISGITAAVMMVTTVPTTPAYAESGATSYSFDGYDVEYSVKNEWSDGKTIEVKITNTSNESILNWAFKYDAEGKVNDLWNASVYSADNTSYIIKNDGWNYEIAPAASVLFGYKLTEFSDNNPTSFILCSKRVDKTDGFDVQYNITKEWDTGLQGEIVISNTSDEPLEAWELAFDSTFEINNLWDGRIISSEDGHYVIASEMWTNPIDIGSTKVIGFTGIKKNTDEQSISNYNLSVVVIDSEATTSGTGGNGGNDEPEPTPEPEIDITTDTDGDKLPDVYEDMYGTDKENPDTDGDGLTDYEEITLTGTDPLVYDSVTEGVSDEDADYDDDGLTTREEMTLGTDPTQADTDSDRINDYDEINVWHTDPLVADTDKDDIVDGDEVKIGLDPTNPETFGYPDIEYKSTQHIAKDSISLSSINNEDNDIFTYSVDVTSNGYVEPYMYARKSCYTSVMQNDFMIGIAPELVYLGEYGIDNIKVSFTVSDEYIEKAKVPEETKEEFLSKINIFRYFESANALLPVETTRDAETGTLSSESDAVTTYCLMNMEAWVNMLKEYASESINDNENENGVPVSVQFNSSSSITSASNDSKATKINNSLRVIFVLQSAGNYEDYFNREKITIDQLALMLYSNYSDAKIAILEYKEYRYSGNIKFYNYYNDFHTALQSISYTICKNQCERGNVFNQIKRCDEFQQSPNKFVMHFVNGSSYNMLIAANHISDCGEYTNVSEFIPKGFKYNYGSSTIAYHIQKHEGLNLCYDSIDTNQLYEHIQNHLKAPEVKFKALVPNNWTIIELKSPLVPGGNTDTDGDTLSDWDEVNHDLLKWDATGHVQQMSVKEFIKEVNELSLDNSTGQFANVDMWAKSLTCIPLISDPTNLDGDGDGIEDKDEFVWNGIDVRYKNVSPLKSDTLETLYPELSMSYANGNNSSFNPVYFYIEGNLINLTCRVHFSGDYNSLVPLAENTGKTMKQAFKEGIEEYWTGNNIGNKYDFYPGMNINMRVHISEFKECPYAINAFFNYNAPIINRCYVECENNICAGGTWTTSNSKTIHINPSYLNRKEKDYLQVYKYLCAHEFGHVLGIWDAYGESSANNGYWISYDPSRTSDSEFFNNELMRCRYEDINTLHNLVVSNEIEMFLQAYIENDWQYFYEGHCSLFRAPIYQYSEFIALNPEAHAIYYEVGAVDQKMSKVIKRPKPTYEKDAAGLNYDYYYWDGTKMQLITTAQSFPSKW